MAKVERRTVELSAYPDLVVIYLGMRVNAWRGLKTLIGFGPKIKTAVEECPTGPPSPRESDLLARAAPSRHAAILARLRCARGLDALAAASRVVA